MYFEETLLDPYFSSTRSNVVNEAPEWKQQLMKDLFKEKKYTLRIESTIWMNISRGNFQYFTITNLVPMEALWGIPNPHHRYYNCWGDNQPNIHRAIQNTDYLTALATAFAAMSGINLSDTAVMQKFITEELYEFHNVPCLENAETGEVITIDEYERRFNNASDATNE